MTGKKNSHHNVSHTLENPSHHPSPRHPSRNGADHDPLELLAPLAVRKHYERGQEIYGQEQTAESWYHVVSGVLRRLVVWSDGRRQIMDFLLPGDFFGFAGGEEHHYFSVEGVATDTVVASYPRRRVELLADTEPAVARLIRQKAFDGILRLQSQIHIIGRTRAPQKVGSFLLEMARRCTDGPGNQIILPMSRYDIADYLAVSVETVCRAMTRLKASGAIALNGTRSVTIVDQAMLEDADREEVSLRTRPE